VNGGSVDLQFRRRRLTRLTSLLGALAVMGLLGVLGTSCGGSPAEPASSSSSAGPVQGTVTLFAYEDGFEAGYIDPFKTMYPNVRLKASAFGNAEESVAKLRAGFEADVINVCAHSNLASMKINNLLQPLDTSRIKDWDRIYPNLKDLPGVVDADGKVWMVPVDAGSTGIQYDPKVVTDPPTSWKDLFDPRYRGKAAIEDQAVKTIPIGAIALGMPDPINLSDAQLEQIKQFYIDKIKDGQFRTFYQNDSDCVNLFKTGEIAITSGYQGLSLQLTQEGTPNNYVLAKDGQMLWVCGYGISSRCKNVDAAYALINYYLSPKAEAYEVNKWYYLVANQDAASLVSEKVRKDAQLDSVAELQKPILGPPPDRMEKWIETWNEIKATH
jgi:spermidine/putrescine-binding protein